VEIRALLSALGRSKAGPLLLAAQVALSLAVIVNVTYVIGQRLADATRPTGLDLGHMFWVTTDASSPEASYAAAVPVDLAYLNALPGVIAATSTSILPQTLTTLDMAVGSSREAAQAPDGGVIASLYLGTDRFVDAMGLRLVAGRRFDPLAVQAPSERMRVALDTWAGEAIVTRALAARLYPDGKALGKPVYGASSARPAVIVGIVDLMRANPLMARSDALATQILILSAIPPGPDAAYVIRTPPGRRDEVMARVGREFGRLHPDRFITCIEAYDVTASRARQSFRATILVLGTVAVVVLLVTAVGTIGLAAFNVSMRTRQLGVRRALGARRLHILRYFIVENWIIMTAGVVVGCLLAVAAGVEFSRVYEVTRLPLYQLAGGVLLLWAVGLSAVLVPALQAAAVPPAVATRSP
jgi:putative ABC transport system permease protein